MGTVVSDGVGQETPEEVAALCRQFQGGCAQALDKLYRIFDRPLYRWLRFLTRDTQKAADLAQDVWLRVIKKLPLPTKVRRGGQVEACNLILGSGIVVIAAYYALIAAGVLATADMKSLLPVCLVSVPCLAWAIHWTSRVPARHLDPDWFE